MTDTQLDLMPNPTAQWCADRQHPWVTYSPWIDRTYCRCGTRQEPGEQPMDWQAKHEVFHSCGDGPCHCYTAPTA